MMVTGKSDLGLCRADDNLYLNKMMRTFVSRFVQSMSLKSSDYLPDDAIIYAGGGRADGFIGR